MKRKYIEGLGLVCSSLSLLLLNYGESVRPSPSLTIEPIQTFVCSSLLILNFVPLVE